MNKQICDPPYIKTFLVGDTVSEEGCYICVPCGEKKQFKKGTTFPRCLACFSRSDRKNIFRNEETWERC